MYITTFEYPQHTKIHKIDCTFSEIREEQLSKKVIPVAQHIPRGMTIRDSTDLLTEDPSVYQANNVYPEEWFTYTIRCGLNNKGIPTTFVTIEIHPVRYHPQQHVTYIIEKATIHINHELPKNTAPTNTNDIYDLVIIAPEEFEQPLQQLVEHKNSYNMKTLLKTTQEIYLEYEGRDPPEQIKYFIKDAKEKHDITYVLLCGGLNSLFWAKDKDTSNHGSTNWYVPVRYNNIKGQSADEYGTPTDLYYADIYRYNEETTEWEFEDWDINGDGTFAEWKFSNKDPLDLMPDVYYGRLACRNIDEVNTVVNKIITYESTPPEQKSWFSRMICIAGRTFTNHEGKPDGEIVCDLAFSYMEDLIDDEIRVYASNIDNGGLVPGAPDITSAISTGAGYVNFEGHGFTGGWATNWPEEAADDWHNWTGFIKLHDYLKLRNGDKLPVILVGGCHNGLFNVSLIRAFLFKIQEKPHCYHASFYPTPECFSWRFVSKPTGGGIASTGCTGYGFGDQDDPITLSAELEANFFYMVGQESAETLGLAHQGGVAKYITEHTLNKIDVHCIVVYQLFGDPSLRLGGYP
jgi:hypothetical protein